MTVCSQPKIKVEELMEKIRAEVQKRRSYEGSPEGALGENLVDRHPADLLCQEPDMESQNSGLPDAPSTFQFKDGGYHINDFLQYHDVEFVKNAYLAILGRQPDAAGYQGFLVALRTAGMTKAEILGRLRYSSEGRSRGTRIKGLLPMFLLHSSFRLPVLGYFGRLATGILNLPAIIRNMQHTDNSFGWQATMMQRKIDALQARVFSEAEFQEKLEARTVDQEDLQELQNRKADRAEVLALADRKLDREEVASLLENLVKREVLIAHGAGKADREEVLALLERKLDREEAGCVLENLLDREVLSTLLKDKVDRQELNPLVAQKADQNALNELCATIKDLSGRIRDHRLLLLDQQRRLGLLLEETRKRLPDRLTREELECMLAEEEHLLDGEYVHFEEHFRGTRGDIKERQRRYLPYVEASGAGLANAPILDLGCGRGEWLDLLKEQGLVARGVDRNRVMVRQCQELGLDVVEADAIKSLRSLPAASLGAVTGFHVIEHVSMRHLVALLDESLRVLMPGGLVIFETPNPENIVVGACDFYLDPTHNRPLHPVSMSYLVEQRGFVRTEIVRFSSEPLTPYSGHVGIEEILTRLKASYEYAIIGYKT
jgi:SAM-dependent methyltransferase